MENRERGETRRGGLMREGGREKERQAREKKRQKRWIETRDEYRMSKRERLNIEFRIRESSYLFTQHPYTLLCLRYHC